ncbi:MAG: hypothetical protein IJF56_04260 [Clostridia bacterium]|nr:hypothetical protein [Clostridia bacterium]
MKKELLKEAKSIVQIALCILFMICTLTACKSVSQEISLAACGSFAVPDIYTFDLKGGSFSCEVLETDTYGRILFKYTTFSETTGEPEKTAYVICQKYDQKHVYYYTDVCYTFEDAADELEKLKTANDWNCEWNDEKVTCHGYTVSFDLFLHGK